MALEIARSENEKFRYRCAAAVILFSIGKAVVDNIS